MSQEHSEQLLQEQLTAKFLWSTFPDQIQKRLFQHYQQFRQQNDERTTEFDLQNATAILYWVAQGVREDQLKRLLEDHKTRFSSASAQDVQDIVQEFEQLRESHGEKEGV